MPQSTPRETLHQVSGIRLQVSELVWVCIYLVGRPIWKVILEEHRRGVWRNPLLYLFI